MRILPVVAAVTAAFSPVVACSSPTPPKGVTVVNNFDAKRYLGNPGDEIARFDHRFERGLDKVTATCTACATTAASTLLTRAITLTGRCGRKRKGKPISPATQAEPRLRFLFSALLWRV